MAVEWKSVATRLMSLLLAVGAWLCFLGASPNAAAVEGRALDAGQCGICKRWISSGLNAHVNQCLRSRQGGGSSGGSGGLSPVDNMLINAAGQIMQNALQQAQQDDAQAQQAAEAQRQQMEAERQRLEQERLRLEAFRREQERLQRLKQATEMRNIWEGEDAATSANLTDLLRVPVPQSTSFFGIPGNPQGGPTVGASSANVVDLTDLDLAKPKIVNTNVVQGLTNTATPADQALMRHQWNMTIDWRYKTDPVVQQDIRNLWQKALRGATLAERVKAYNRMKQILADQLKVNGWTPQAVADFFGKVDDFSSGPATAPKSLQKASKLARSLDTTIVQDPAEPSGYPPINTTEEYKKLVQEIGRAEGIKVKAAFMSASKQTKDDCVLYSIADGAQVPVTKVKAAFSAMAKDLAMDSIEERKNPALITMQSIQGGRGGLIQPEEMLVAHHFGEISVFGKSDFSKALETTGHPIVTCVDMQNAAGKFVGQHAVVITGVHRLKGTAGNPGKTYYAVMDSNFSGDPNFTRYIERTRFEDSMSFEGGYVITPRPRP
jgi:hypothetical protein